MVTLSEPTAKLEHKGYNRGLILGLTMAESMLLLVFCLLLVAAAIINAERQKALLATQKLQAATERVSALTKENELLEQQMKGLLQRLEAVLGYAKDAEAISKEWRELVEAREDLAAFREQGLSPEQIVELKKLAAILENAGMPVDDSTKLAGRLNELLRDEAEQAASKPHEWPPIINLSEAGGYFFRSGSAELAEAFEEKLRGSIGEEIAQNLKRYQVDVIEVIGHTDEQPISRTGSNVDQEIIDVVDGRKPITAIVPADNAGLGMARAIAVMNVLRSDPALKDATILPMSGAQLVLPSDRLTTRQAGNVESRRRIEIRIRRRTVAATP